MAKTFSLGGLVDTDAKSPDQKTGQGTRGKPKKKAAPVQIAPSKRLSLVLDGETYQALRLLAFESGRTHQDILDEAARAYLRKHVSTHGAEE
ncbi:CopG family transcriptional regulator [Cribrihabitans sp. XS_ASV171]